MVQVVSRWECNTSWWMELLGGWSIEKQVTVSASPIVLEELKPAVLKTVKRADCVEATPSTEVVFEL